MLWLVCMHQTQHLLKQISSKTNTKRSTLQPNLLPPSLNDLSFVCQAIEWPLLIARTLESVEGRSAAILLLIWPPSICISFSGGGYRTTPLSKIHHSWSIYHKLATEADRRQSGIMQQPRHERPLILLKCAAGNLSSQGDTGCTEERSRPQISTPLQSKSLRFDVVALGAR